MGKSWSPNLLVLIVPLRLTAGSHCSVKGLRVSLTENAETKDPVRSSGWGMKSPWYIVLRWGQPVNYRAGADMHRYCACTSSKFE